MLIDPTGKRPSNARLAGKGGGRVYFDPYTGDKVAALAGQACIGRTLASRIDQHTGDRLLL
ncbi:hypothetical protein, partial [Xanthomonas arboricola]|uniref:hypothetical protein n=1 Tax=Xanthomonas arboricola TaxID=56448 RepID=UPI0015E2A23F